MQLIRDIAQQLDLNDTDFELYGNYKAKLDLSLLNRTSKGKLILMTAINPTPAGEGKTTMNVGLSMALNQLGHKAISALREPSLGPVFGMKGGATGGGKAQVVPIDDINLHFTGDLHAITSAHNLLAAMLDNHIFHGNALEIDLERIVWGRVMDMNDRALRSIQLKKHESFFDITAASEVMAIVCLARDMDDLHERLERIVVGYTVSGAKVCAKDLKAVGAMVLLLKDAMRPNLVQTLEGTPAILHGGPFANIAHGCNSLIATKMALNLADYVVTEAGFGADLGAEKFYDIKCRLGNLKPDATVLVATIRALKYNGGVAVADLADENVDALEVGCQNLVRHIQNLKKFSQNVIVTLNKFATDTQAELECVKRIASSEGVQVIEANVFEHGGAGALELAQAVVDLCEKDSEFKVLYDSTKNVYEAIETVAKEIYRAKTVTYSEEAQVKINEVLNDYPQGLPVCIAKTQYSFSDDPKALNAPTDFTIHVRDVRLSQGAGFLVVILGKIMTMPGLPKIPNAETM